MLWGWSYWKSNKDIFFEYFPWPKLAQFQSLWKVVLAVKSVTTKIWQTFLSYVAAPNINAILTFFNSCRTLEMIDRQINVLYYFQRGHSQWPLQSQVSSMWVVFKPMLWRCWFKLCSTGSNWASINILFKRKGFLVLMLK